MRGFCDHNSFAVVGMAVPPRVDLFRACETLRDPDRRLADAVEARQEIDLRSGAAFTRWMTLRYQAT